MQIIDIFKNAIALKASDIHLAEGGPIMFRRLGELERFGDKVLSAHEYQTAEHALREANDLNQVKTRHSLDFAHTDTLLGRRFRINAYDRQHGRSMAIRVIAPKISTLTEINAPQVLLQQIERPSGLLLLVGPVGSGKSTTADAIIDHINETRACHILAFGDPIEQIHVSKKALVTQRDLIKHAGGFEAAARAAVRQDPDVVSIGEMRDIQTIRLGLRLAELGRFVVATMHANSAPKAVTRILDEIPAGEKEFYRASLAENLVAVASQRLLPNRDRTERLAVFEMMITTPSVQNAIRDNKVPSIRNTMSTSSAEGMCTLEQALNHAIRSGKITLDVAKRFASNPQDLRG